MIMKVNMNSIILRGLISYSNGLVLFGMVQFYRIIWIILQSYQNPDWAEQQFFNMIGFLTVLKEMMNYSYQWRFGYSSAWSYLYVRKFIIWMVCVAINGVILSFCFDGNTIATWYLQHTCWLLLGHHHSSPSLLSIHYVN